MQTDHNHVIILVITTTALLLLLVAATIALLYFYQKRHLNFQKNLNVLKLDFEKMLLKTHLEVQEQTFQHISREIHDNINLSLVLAKLNLNKIDWNSPETIKWTVNQAIDTLTTAIRDLSNLSKSTSTELIKDLGLLQAIKHEVERIKALSGITVITKLSGEPIFLNGEKELIAFRIIQEAFNNVIKHSSANQVKLHLNYSDQHLEVTVEDNGIGFDKERALNKKSESTAGLKNMLTRARSFGGDIEIISKNREGTRIEFKLPYKI